MACIAVRLIVRGHVQGVGYRWWACGVARRLGLSGWVRNLTDGTVELVAAGEAEAVEQLAAVCRDGPSAAWVTSVERCQTADPDVTTFEARPTA